MGRLYKQGDIVQLKSGGPQMTVNDYAWHGNYKSEDTVVCIWFDGTKRKTAEFHQDTVKQAVND